MSKLIYVSLEHIDGRYTVHMDIAIEEYLVRENIEYIKVMPTYDTPPLPEGQFLNSAFTSKFKALQIAEISDLIERGVIEDGDTLFFSDIWFPGIESIAYMKYFNKMDNLKITASYMLVVLQIQTLSPTWNVGQKTLKILFLILVTQSYCASNFIKNDIIKKRIVDPNKLVVSHYVDYSGLDPYKGQTKKNIVIFNGRICDEKQPWLFKELGKQVNERVSENVEFIRTQDMNLSKEEYYKLLGKSKAVVSYALQENFGFGVAEAVYLGCTPVLPNRLVYPELYPDVKLYDRFDESVDMVVEAIENYQEQQIVLPTEQVFDIWFGGGSNE